MSMLDLLVPGLDMENLQVQMRAFVLTIKETQAAIVRIEVKLDKLQETINQRGLEDGRENRTD